MVELIQLCYSYSFSNFQRPILENGIEAQPAQLEPSDEGRGPDEPFGVQSSSRFSMVPTKCTAQ
jgi:hypothetical protein